jgi:hypothetical protein
MLVGGTELPLPASRLNGHQSKSTQAIDDHNGFAIFEVHGEREAICQNAMSTRVLPQRNGPALIRQGTGPVDTYKQCAEPLASGDLGMSGNLHNAASAEKFLNYLLKR